MRELTNIQRASAPSPAENIYLLIDGATIDAPYVAYSLDDGPQIEALFYGTRHSALMEVSPWIVRPSQASKLIEHSDKWRDAGIVLKSSAPMPRLVDHLRSLLSVTLPSGQLAHCRFYSPAWAARLFNTMFSEEFTLWCGPVEEWVIYTEESWYSAAPRHPGLARGIADEGWFPLRAEQLEQWATQERASFVNRVLLHLFPDAQNPFREELKDEISRLIQLAADYDLRLEYQVFHFLELWSRFPKELETSYWAKHFASEQDPEMKLRKAEQKLFGAFDNA